jgi:hypothetical protein
MFNLVGRTLKVILTPNIALLLLLPPPPPPHE